MKYDPLGKRLFDLFLAIVACIILAPVAFLICIAVFINMGTPIFFISKRVGISNKLFSMYKFRTMNANAPLVATHLLGQSSSFVTPLGSVLRRYSLDELPQIINILKGEMSFVGPRPALFNQDDLIQLRASFGVDSLMPGLTGLAQISGRDSIGIKQKVDLDCEYKKNITFLGDVKILMLTFKKAFTGSDVVH